jgi:hypothetical protein
MVMAPGLLGYGKKPVIKSIWSVDLIKQAKTKKKKSSWYNLGISKRIQEMSPREIE